MKILKIRRGYTTNSSSASEFIPPNGAQPGTDPNAPIVPPAPVPYNPPAAATPGANVANPPAVMTAEPAAARPFPVPVKSAPTGHHAQAPAAAVSSAEPAPAPATPASAPAAAPAQTAQVVQPTPPAQPPTSHSGGNGLLVGGFAALVALAFVLEKVMRRMFRSKRPADDQD